MQCPICFQHPAEYHHIFGVLPCRACQVRQSTIAHPNTQVEFVPEYIKEDRKMNFDDIHPAHRKGQASSEFRDRWGAEVMKRQGFSEREIATAKPVWNDDKYYQEHS